MQIQQSMYMAGGVFIEYGISKMHVCVLYMNVSIIANWGYRVGQLPYPTLGQ